MSAGVGVSSRKAGGLAVCAARQATAESGYVLVDALVALLVLSLALVFGLRAAAEARTALDQASEIRGAHLLLSQLLETGPRSLRDTGGDTDAFAWTIETRATGAEQPVALCHRQVRLTSHRSHRAYSAATLETCPIEPAA